MLMDESFSVLSRVAMRVCVNGGGEGGVLWEGRRKGRMIEENQWATCAP